ncbi:MAG: M28 family metallopeptidase, partial [Rhodothermia bacterium]
VVLGAHFDSWDLGQGAMDNGLGVAQLYEMARLLNKYQPDNFHTIEFVWFNAEELGLWGSKAYVARHEKDLDSLYAMINFDMAGRPIQLNAMGFSELIPVLEEASSRLGNWSFDKPVANKTWLGSDHHPFVLAGVPTVTFNAPIDEESVKFYHDFGDTFDKIDRKMLAQGTAVYTLVALDLANNPTPLRRYDQAEVEKIFVEAGLEERMRAAEAWPF